MTVVAREIQGYDLFIEEALQNGVSAGTITGMIILDQAHNQHISCLPESDFFEYVQHKEQQYLSALNAREEEIDRQLVIDLAMKIINSNDMGVYFDDLSVYGDRPDNLGIDDGQEIVFYATPEGVRVNNMTADHMQLLKDVLIGLERFESVTAHLSRDQRFDLMCSIKTTTELHGLE